MNFGNEWNHLLKKEFERPYFKEIGDFLSQEREKFTVFPDNDNIFDAFRYTSYSDVKAVILGQDPYHQPNQAHGLCFSVKKGNRLPPSLINIFKELYNDRGITRPPHGELTHWAKSGVLLLNSILTVRKGQPNSHRKIGWEEFTDKVIGILNKREQPLVFILWGKYAQSKSRLVNGSRHLVLTGAHPSPLSANKGGYFDERYFSRTNDFLHEQGIPAIDWEIK